MLAIGLATASAAEMPMAGAAIDFLSVRMANIAFETSRMIVHCHVSGFPLLLQIAFEDRTDSRSLLHAGRPRRGARAAVRKSFQALNSGRLSFAEKSDISTRRAAGIACRRAMTLDRPNTGE
jgi:hypothetical protein